MRNLTLSALICAASLGLAACESEGPAERAGEELDQAADDVGEAVEEAGEEVRDETRRE